MFQQAGADTGCIVILEVAHLNLGHSFLYLLEMTLFKLKILCGRVYFKAVVSDIPSIKEDIQSLAV
jgi:hypothetical protein